jgi:hypothetical protein
MKIMRLAAIVAFAVAALTANALVVPAKAEPIRIVAFGGSSTYGKGVDRQDTYIDRTLIRLNLSGLFVPRATT